MHLSAATSGMAKAHSPSLVRFLSDFTLGFSDGLTVPFALTAGLSSLGRADTVIYAGLAELCAGSISMGIGGYLSAVDELPRARARSDDGDDGDDDEASGMLRRASIGDKDADGGRSPGHDGHLGRDGGLGHDDGRRGRDEELVRRHLAPLGLPAATVCDVMAALQGGADGADGADGLRRAAVRLRPLSPLRIDEAPRPYARPPAWPVASGLSISLGYVVGGTIPLSPYFFAPTVGLGLRWSIGLCLVALMAFGAGKSWLLRDEDGARCWRRCLLRGLQMLVLGSLAAGAAVLCVNLLGGSQDSPR